MMEDFTFSLCSSPPSNPLRNDFYQFYAEQGLDQIISNINTDSTSMYYLHIHKQDKPYGVIPLTINKKPSVDYNIFTVSPFHHYITYGKVELQINPIHPFIVMVMSAIIDVFALFFRWTKLDQVVIVGNLMLSTNLYNDMYHQSEAFYTKLTHFIMEHFPSHTLMFRSLNDKIYRPILDSLDRIGYSKIPSRMIYTLDTTDEGAVSQCLQKRDVKDDRKLLLKYLSHTYVIKENSELMDNVHIQEIVSLYNMLYVGKYSQCNIQFNERFVGETMRRGLIQYKCLIDRETDRMHGVIGYFIKPFHGSNVMTCPVLGYDTGRVERPLYRLLSSILLGDALNVKIRGDLEGVDQSVCSLYECNVEYCAKKKGVVFFNQSSGASKFKMNRGCQPAIEYTSFYDSHLPFYRRLPFYFLRFMLNVVAKPIMEHYQL